VPKSDDDKCRRQERPSEPQPPSVTMTTDVALTLAGSSPTAEPEAQRTHRGSAAAAGSYVDWATLLRRGYDRSPGQKGTPLRSPEAHDHENQRPSKESQTDLLPSPYRL